MRLPLRDSTPVASSESLSDGYDPAKARRLYIAWRLVKVAKAGGDPELLRQQIAEFEETLQDFLR